MPRSTRTRRGGFVSVAVRVAGSSSSKGTKTPGLAGASVMGRTGYYANRELVFDGLPLALA
jgi:hypothetical protein